MSTNSTISNAKRVAMNKKGKKKQSVATEAPVLSDTHWKNTPVKGVAAILAKEGKEKRVRFVRRSKLANGKYAKLSSSDARNMLSTVTAPFLLSPSSHLSGEGDLGTGTEFEIHRGNCKITATLMIGNLRDGVDRGDLEEEQRACMKHYGDISRKLMHDLFDLNVEIWKGPIERAMTDARKELYKDVTEADGTPIKSFRDMARIERDNPEVNDRVRSYAKKLFIDNAHYLPGIPKADEDGNMREPVLRLQRKAWQYVKFDAARDSKSQEKGPSIDEYPSTLDHWYEIHSEMTNPTGRMRRKFNPIDYADGATGKTIKRPPVTIVGEKIDREGKRVAVTKTIDDPFFDPCLKGPKDKAYQSIVATEVLWQLYRGPSDSTEKYGIHLIISGPISIVCRAPSKQKVVVVHAAYATGYVDDVEEEDEKEDGEVEEGEGDEGDGEEGETEDDGLSATKQNDVGSEASTNRKRGRADDHEADDGTEEMAELPETTQPPKKRARKPAPVEAMAESEDDEDDAEDEMPR